MQHDTGEAGHRLARTLEAHGLTVGSRIDWTTCSEMLTVEISGGAEIWIADSTGHTDSPVEEHPGWVAHYRPHGGRDDEGNSTVYRSEGAKGFLRDTAALVTVVVQCATARSLAPAMNAVRVHEARAMAYLARQDAGPPPVNPGDRAEWLEERRAALDSYRAGRAVAVGVNRLDTVRRAAEAGRYDARAHQGLAEALAAVEHGGMSSWRATPYGVVWIDNEI